MPRKVYRPTRGQTIWLLAVAAATIGAALYVRYRIIEVSPLGLACDAGWQDWRCDVRKGATILFNNSVFAWTALIAAGLNLYRPSLVLFTLGLLAGCAGVVLYNGTIAALALGLLIFSLARPAPESELPPTQ